MGLGGLSMGHLLVVLIVVVLVFGTKKLSSFGSDVGGAIKNFKKAMAEEEDSAKSEQADAETKRVTEKTAASAETVKSESVKSETKQS